MDLLTKPGFGAAGCLIVCLTAFSAIKASSDEVVQIPVRVEGRKKTEKHSSVESLMQAKLKDAEKILAGLVMHDFEQIAASAESLKLMSLKPPKGWEKNGNDDEVYEHFRMEFMRLSARLEQEARTKNLAGAAWFQQNLTATCIACHDYIRDEELKGK